MERKESGRVKVGGKAKNKKGTKRGKKKKR